MKYAIKFNHFNTEYTAKVFNNPSDLGKWATDKNYICTVDGYDIYNPLTRKDTGYENLFIAFKHGEITEDLSEIYRNKYEMLNGMLEDQSEMHFCVEDIHDQETFNDFCDMVKDRTGYRFDRTYYREIRDSILYYAAFTK